MLADRPPSNGIIRNTDTPILAYTQTNGNKTQIAISDPDLRIGAQDESVMQNSVMKTARITLSGNQTLSGGANGVKVVESGKDFTVLEIACRDGKTVEFEVTGAEEAKPAHGLTVSGGNGSGVYRAGDVVAIECDVPEGKVFSHWIAEGIALSEEQLSSPKLTFTMPDGEVKLTAAFADSVSGNSTSDTVILIVCLACALLALAAIAVIVCLYLKRKRSKP